jgi:starch synthase
VEAADAVIAVSSGMKKDILAAYPGVSAERVHVIYNGIDPAEYMRDAGTDVLAAQGIDPARPYVVFVGRITRQKGIVHLLRAAQHLAPEAQLVLCAGEPDTKEIGEEVGKLVAEVKARRAGVILIERMLPRPQLMQILSHARVFACPSVYEPFGIVNLEAMACGTAVVASAVGGIPEVVDQGKTGYLVPFGGDGTARNEPRDPDQFSSDFAEKLNVLIADEALAHRMGEAGRERVVQRFSWSSIAAQTVKLYRSLLRPPGARA